MLAIRSYRRPVLAALLVVVTTLLGCSSNNAGSGTAVVAKTATTVAATRATTGTAAPASSSTPVAVVSPATFPLTVKRSDGRDLVLKAAPKRIASLSPGTTEILYAIGAQPQIVATDTYSDYPAEAKSTPKLDGFRPSPEAITALSPDLVILVDNPKGIVETLDGLGMQVLWLKVPEALPQLLQQIQLYGDISGHGAAAQQTVAGMRARIDAVQNRLAGVQQGPRVYHELDAKLFSAAPNSFVGDLYTTLKAQNIVPAGDKPYPQVTQEFVVAKDPEVIVLTDAVAGESIDTVRARSGWSTISAVKNSRVVAVDGDLVSRPGPRIVDGLETLAKVLYPDRF